MAIIEIQKTTNLDVTVTADPLHGYIFTNESDGHKFVITGTRSGSPVTLAGVVTARFKRNNKTTVFIAGDKAKIENGKAVVTLLKDCYNVPGRFDFYVYVTSGGATTCVYYGTGTVNQTEEGTLIDSGEAVPSLEELTEVVQDAQAATSEAENVNVTQTKSGNAITLTTTDRNGTTVSNILTDPSGIIASDFDASLAYSAGTYVIYTDGNLYRLTSDHEANVAWSDTGKTQVTIGAEVTNLKSTFDHTLIQATWLNNIRVNIDTTEKTITISKCGSSRSLVQTPRGYCNITGSFPQVINYLDGVTSAYTYALILRKDTRRFDWIKVGSAFNNEVTVNNSVVIFTAYIGTSGNFLAYPNILCNNVYMDGSLVGYVNYESFQEKKYVDGFVSVYREVNNYDHDYINFDTANNKIVVRFSGRVPSQHALLGTSSGYYLGKEVTLSDDVFTSQYMRVLYIDGDTGELQYRKVNEVQTKDEVLLCIFYTTQTHRINWVNAPDELKEYIEINHNPVFARLNDDVGRVFTKYLYTGKVGLVDSIPLDGNSEYSIIISDAVFYKRKLVLYEIYGDDATGNTYRTIIHITGNGQYAFSTRENTNNLRIWCGEDNDAVVPEGEAALLGCRVEIIKKTDTVLGKLENLIAKVDGLETSGDVEYSESDVGCLTYQEIGETDYSQIILYGQSLSMGWEAPEVITTSPEKNCYMVGSKPLINHGNDGSLVLNPLIASKWTSGGEEPIVAMTNAFAKMYNRFVDRNQKFIGTNCGEGGRSIERLSKACTNGTNYYTEEFLDCVNSTKAACEAVNKTVSCSAIVFMQGEYNYTNLSGNGLTPGTDATNDKEQYKAYLTQLKNDMQDDIVRLYSQQNKPLFFIYQVAGNYINNKQMTINMAQVEFAKENDDVILLNSTYGLPDYNGGHLSTNGYRWYGELVAKQLYNVFVRGRHYESVEWRDIGVSENKIIIKCYVPVKPLVADTWTKETIANYGFRAYMNGTEVTINSVAVIGDMVVLTCASQLSGTIELTYGGQGRSGSGNIRDSDNYMSMYTYYDDRESSPSKRENYTPKNEIGEYIYGKRYPMYNWLNQFYTSIQVS